MGKDVKMVMMKKKSNKSPTKTIGGDDETGRSSLMRSTSDESLNTEEELDINWREGWSRIEQYIDIVDSEDASVENDLELQVEMTETNGTGSDSTPKKDHELI